MRPILAAYTPWTEPWARSRHPGADPSRGDDPGARDGASLQEHGRRTGWTFAWASSLGSRSDHDFGVSSTDEQPAQGAG